MDTALLTEHRATHLWHAGHAARLAELVVTALIDEVTLSPKPGLVDVRGRGAHRDLDWALMCRSAHALRPAFQAMAEAGATLAEAVTLRERIGRLGRDGEAAMLAATGGVNTHRGAIWALGLLITAATQAPAACAPQQVASRAGRLANTPDRHAPRRTGHKGERARLDYGVGGARGQAEAGFPHVVEVALPALWRARAAGVAEDAARLDALLALMSLLDDTCVLARGGPAALDAVQAGAARVLDAGGSASPAGRRALMRLDAELLALNVSPGGSADLLAAALFLDRLNNAAPAPDGRP
ncbi:triphosphoribosyl-dephospho-CoA synthase MdcB [Pseudogulbenkiania sp. NH8B]|uniref:triphosphoribosyl-dephospho-CoA synthase n=1 Tax=Pseudogulbenkiania sp. (strain NH8B) TaxID=748280 RepID=UPI0002279E9A|nr:triphosphoribosyl-dephospho-CoA synthase [Pseudogulbenkiania sp. NH8B]BAK77770.1 triphosphoribosyl-dephospho-CoA synthase MdcB [Pseudogulbenkiania sp. NH8B]